MNREDNKARIDTYVDAEIKDRIEQLMKEHGLTFGETLRLLLDTYELLRELPKREFLDYIKALAKKHGVRTRTLFTVIVLEGLKNEEKTVELAKTIERIREVL